MTDFYAIGDIHGHLELLKRAHDRIEADIARHGPAPVIHLGDLVDRGPDSKGVLDWLIAGIGSGQDWQVLKGNHDRMFTRFLMDPHAPEPGLRADLSWLHPKLGGPTTLASYGIRNAGDRPIAPVHAEALEAVPQSHRDFIDSRPTWLRFGDTVLAHAGIRPGIAMEDQAEDDLVWIREGWLDHRGGADPLVIHGHTALPQATHYGHRVNIDSSAAYGGPLTAIAFENGQAFVLTDQGRALLPVTPDAPVR